MSEKNHLKKIKYFALLRSAIYIICGIGLLVFPHVAQLTICYIFGGVIALFGVCEILDYFIYGYEPFGFLKGIIDIAVGTIVVLIAKPVCGSSFVAIVFGIIFVIRNIFGIQSALDYRRAGIREWWVDLLCAVVMIALGVILIFSPFGSQAVLMFLAISALAEGVFSLIITLALSSRIEKTRKVIKEEFWPDITFMSDENQDGANNDASAHSFDRKDV